MVRSGHSLAPEDKTSATLLIRLFADCTTGASAAADKAPKGTPTKGALAPGAKSAAGGLPPVAKKKKGGLFGRK